MKLSFLAKELPDCEIIGGDAEISALCTDSRVAGAGDLFFCFQGTHFDSHCFAEEAQLRGAAAIVSQQDTGVGIPQLIVHDGREAMARISAAFYRHPERKISIVGITGTNGKTTTMYMLKNILEEAGKKVGIIGTLGASYSEVTVAPSLTTPDPVFLFSLLADMARAGTEYVVMEVSAHALALRKECPVVYDAAIFTNLTQDHLDFFGDMRSYGNAKKSLFTPERCRFAVLNSDDPFSAELMKQGITYKTYGMENPSDSFALVNRESLRGTHVVLNLSDELCHAEITLTGRHNVYNALAAATAARHLGADTQSIARGLKKTQVNGRLERVASYKGAEIFVDFAHTPDGLEKSLGALKEYCEGRLIVLFGCGGNRDSAKRPIMGKVAAEHCDFAVITSDNPRYEDPLEIISAIEKGFLPVSKNYTVIEEREVATRYAIGLLEKGDVLLVAGKGGECEQEIMGIKYSYNDKAVINSVLNSL
ncbi:MAG: UDP-N-acetylmuramoyl-L-alanyl-D-glutamate--2,6-diaminopimelate ligase [Clostridia bacterium]|nr:UDP-N-acetylmuramoyl-L-alanyl-D-glutamate--2,6-diaminopimelate ligase [Clostridia bacterium]